jgi:DNA polymerase III subunit gamma/tau
LSMSDLFPTIEPESSVQLGLLGEAAPTALAASSGAAAYRVLARKYRPRTFTELIGQDVVVRTLTNAIRTNRLAQAWMLTGVRGVGKTTTARIIARALNCLGADGQGTATPEPCGVCGNCVAIAADRHVDVLEMDAASRTGVDDIREIIDGVRYNPVNARYKIYIIDEVHMLTKNAFNALLKTLEEPPPHVKFIFATTEIRKVPVTVLSRCQRFDLRRVEVAVLTQHFARIAAAENATIEPEALTIIARASDGSVRDGLSLLDQAIARGESAVTLEIVRDMLGLADRARLMDLTRQTLLGDMPAALGTYANLLQNGADPLVVLQDVAELVHLLTRAKLVPTLPQGDALPELEKDFIAAVGALTIPALSRAWQIMLKGIEEVQRAANPAPAAEMVLIRLAYAAALPPPADLVRKLQQEQAEANAAGAVVPPAGDGGSRGQTLQAAPRHGVPSNRGGLAVAVRNAAPLAVVAAVSAVPDTLPMPHDFAALVALFAERKEMNLYSQLFQYAQLVRFEVGRLELVLLPQAAPDLASKVSKCLTDWTSQRWMVTLAREHGQPTLAATEQARALAEREAVIAHPLVQEALRLFPGAKLARIRPPQPVVPLHNETTDDTVLSEAAILLDGFNEEQDE